MFQTQPGSGDTMGRILRTASEEVGRVYAEAQNQIASLQKELLDTKERLKGAEKTGEEHFTIRQQLLELNTRLMAAPTGERSSSVPHDLAEAAREISQLKEKLAEAERRSIVLPDTWGLSISNNNAAGWFAVGDGLDPENGSIFIEGRSHTMCSCMEKVLAVKPDHVPSWCNLALCASLMSTVTVGGNTYTEVGCYEKAVGLDPKDADVWDTLGAALERVAGDAVATVDGASYSSRQCFLKALSLNSDSESAWYNLGTTLGDEKVRVGESEFSEGDCYVKAVHLDPSYDLAWVSLGQTLVSSNSKVSVRRIEFTAENCFHKACSLNPNNASAWRGLALCMEDNTEVMPLCGNERLSKRKCLERAIALDSTDACLWSALGDVAEAEGDITIEGEVFTVRQCRQRAVQLQPDAALFWVGLARCFSSLWDRVDINGTSYTQHDCLNKAVGIDPSCGDAWRLFGDIIQFGVVMIDGKRFTKEACYANAERACATVAATQ